VKRIPFVRRGLMIDYFGPLGHRVKSRRHSGYRDRPVYENPALNLRCARLRNAVRPKVDPFSTHDAETLIATIHRSWGEAQGNYDEFRFFTGLRPSEQIALLLSDIDLSSHGIISINKARVFASSVASRARRTTSSFSCSPNPITKLDPGLHGKRTAEATFLRRSQSANWFACRIPQPSGCR
jgi:integrase